MIQPERIQYVTDALLQTTTMLSPAGRDGVVNDLGDVRSRIRRDPIPLHDTRNIVEATFSDPTNFDKLIESVRYYEGAQSAVMLEVDFAVSAARAPFGLNSELWSRLWALATQAEVNAEITQRAWRHINRRIPLGTTPASLGTIVSKLTQYPVQHLFEFLERVSLTLQMPAFATWVDDAADFLSMRHDLDTLRNRIAGEVEDEISLIVQLQPTAPGQVEVYAWIVHGDAPPRSFYEPAASRPFEQVELIVDELVGQVQCLSSRFSVEFIVPRKFICRAYEYWNHDVDGIKIPLGAYHPVVLRSYERLQNRRFRKVWEEKWKAAVRMQPPDPFRIQAPDQHQAAQLLALLRPYDAGAWVVLGYSPPSEPSTPDSLVLAVNAGSPIILWVADANGSQRAQEDLETLIAGGRPTALPQAVHEYRRQAVADGSYLCAPRVALMFDDPRRAPQLIPMMRPKLQATG